MPSLSRGSIQWSCLYSCVLAAPWQRIHQLPSLSGGLFERGTLSPLFLSADSHTRWTKENVEAKNDDIDDVAKSISQSAKEEYRSKHSGCALCGVTAVENGKELMHCSKCTSVAYCFRDRRKLNK